MIDPAATRVPIGMPSTRWLRLEFLLEQALAREAAERIGFLSANCPDDPDLVREVLSLVDAAGLHGGPLERLSDAVRPEPAGGVEADDESIYIGPYRLVRELGHGGMGVVYLASRADGQYTRDVALKLAQSPLLDPGRRDRFLAERDILARLSHRNIAALFDGGVTDEGHPYFTMEYVDGRPIDAYCDDERLDTAARVRLFLQVCDAVSAAHRSLVVHRDLKPTNVLVNAHGDVKLLDFGIAKLLDPVQPANQTRVAGRLFTRDYASPEQVRGDAVTTASDVYSLGGVLYRLLTGAVAHRFDDDTPSHIEHVICDLEPPRPSAAASPRVRRVLAGDLDNIVLKALSKDPVRRYASVERFAEDLDRCLRGLPVAARADSRAYRAGKFVQRHRVAVAASALVIVALVASTVATLVQAQRARASAARAQRVSTLVTDLFKLAEPGTTEGGAITARELLDRGAERIEIALADDPDAQATMYGVVGRLYRNLALNEAAGRALERALELRRQTAGPESLPFAEALDNVAHLREESGEYTVAEQLHRRALAVRRRLTAPSPQLAASLEGLGRVLSASGRHTQAEAPLMEALELRRRDSAAHGAELIETLHELALARLRGGNAPAGEPLFREAVELGRRLPGASADLRVKGLVNLARLRLRFERKPAEAELLYREALDLARRWYPSGHPDIAVCLSELAGVLRERGTLEEAEARATEALAMLQSLYGPDHREVIVATQRLAGVLADRGRTADADRLHRQALATSQSALGDGHPLTLGAQSDLAAFLQGQGELDEAGRLRTAGLEAARRAYGEKDVYVARAWAALGEFHAATGDATRAEGELRRALEIRRQLHAPGDRRIADAQTSLAVVLIDLDRPAEAEALLVEAVTMLERQPETNRREREAAARHLANVRRGRSVQAAR
jgi:tetratricopeptide (TPR) repeat protein/predicted Ser/Thr protein kinase